VVALVGVYFLGRHSSSFGISHNGEEEKRFLRGPFRYRLHSQHQDTEQKETSYIVERVDQRTSTNPLQKTNSDSVDTKSASKVLQKLADTVADLAQGDDDVAIDNSDVVDIHVDYEDHYNEEEQEATNSLSKKDTKSLTNKQTADQVMDSKQNSTSTTKLPSSESHVKDLDDHNMGSDRGKDSQSIKPSQVARHQDLKVNNTSKQEVKSTNENKAGEANIVKPKPTVLTSKSSKVASKPYTTTTSTVNSKEPASSRFAGGIKVQEILKDKLFVLKSDKNIEDQFLKMLKTLPYSSLLKQATASLPSADNSTYKFNKFGYNKELSDSLPLLRDLPDNRDIRLVAIGIM